MCCQTHIAIQSDPTYYAHLYDKHFRTLDKRISAFRRGFLSYKPAHYHDRHPINYKQHCQLLFGSYVQAHQEPSPTNTQAACTVGAICLGPTSNIQGSYYFLNLSTGKCITRRRWTQLPMPQEVIDRVNQLGTAEAQPQLLTFYNRRGLLIGDSVTQEC